MKALIRGAGDECIPMRGEELGPARFTMFWAWSLEEKREVIGDAVAFLCARDRP